MAIADVKATSRLAPGFRVWINGGELPPPAANDVIGLSALQDVSAPGMCTLRILNRDRVNTRVSWSDDVLFSEGNEVEVLMGYSEELGPVFNGEITGLEPEFRSDEVPILTVRAHDRRHRLMRGRKTRTFTRVKDSDVAARVAREAGLTPEVTDTAAVLDYVLQANQTDLEFLEARARRLGFEVVVEGKTLRFRPHANTGAEVLTLSRDADLIEFYPRLTTLGQAGEVTVRGWSPKDKAAVVGRAGAFDVGGTMAGGLAGPAVADQAFGAASIASVDQPVFNQTEADRIAAGRLREMALASVTGEGVAVGRPDLKAGTVIRVEGFGRRFSGLYYLTSVCHTYLPGRGYRTAFTVRRNAA